MESKYERIYNRLSQEYSISAREYFMILRLAICHIDGKYLSSSSEITQHDTTDKAYHCACGLLKTLCKED